MVLAFLLLLTAVGALESTPLSVNLTKIRLLQASTADERAQCQCSVNGRSGRIDVLYWSSQRSIYPSENIEYGGPYKFIGCGAHKYYRDKAEDQIAGYPWRFCYTYGGQAGCQMTKTSQKYSLNGVIAYRFCNGDYECNTKAQLVVANGTLVESQVLEETDSDGHLQDWTNCCRLCRVTSGCKEWDFSVETMVCRLFSEVVSTRSTSGTSENGAPYWYHGTLGFDDAPATCWFRNEYETCNDNFRAIFLAVVILGLIGVLLLLVLLGIVFYPGGGHIYGWTNDVTPDLRRLSLKDALLNMARKPTTSLYTLLPWCTRSTGTCVARLCEWKVSQLRKTQSSFSSQMSI